ncbi:MAG TPA: helix-turn-helix domain-containing protein [Herbaspirillum sp.]|jgi:DNA-binding IclR family transcriptional regulator
MLKEMPENTETEQKGGVIALERGLRVLMALNVEDGLTLSEIARKTDLNKTTVLRLLLSLERLAFVHRIGDRYKVGAAVFVLVGEQSEAGFVRDLVTPTLRDLAKATGETAIFYMKHGKQRICVARAVGSQLVRPNVAIGDVLPFVGATGRVFIEYAAGRPEGYEGSFQKNFGERNPEVAAIAAPIFARNGSLLGALSLSGTCIRFTAPSHLAEISEALLNACKALNQSLAS